MTMTESESLTREWFEQVWNRQDESAIDRLMSPDAIAHGLAPAPLRGPAQFKPYYHRMRQALPDIHVSIERAVTQGDTCVVLCHVTGMHTGEGLGAPPTNRAVDFWGMTMIRTKDGRVVEGWNTFDFLSMFQQLGWVQNPVVG